VAPALLLLYGARFGSLKSVYSKVNVAKFIEIISVELVIFTNRVIHLEL
jgi:hypothetical protein